MRKGSDGPRRGGEAGLTLIEVAVAVVVLTLVLVLAAPAVPRARSGADAAAHALGRLLDRGRLAAVRGGIEVAVEVDPAGGGYRVLTAGAHGADSVLGSGTLPVDSATRIAPPGVEPLAVLRFGALGRAEGGPVRVRDAGSREWVVSVNRWTGRTRVWTE